MGKNDKKVLYEKLLIGMVMNNPSLVPKLAEQNLNRKLLTHHHAVLLDAILDCYINGQTPTPVLVASKVPSKDKQKVHQYIESLMAIPDTKSVTLGNLEYCVNVLKQMYEMHAMRSLAEQTLSAVEKDGGVEAIKAKWMDLLLSGTANDEQVRRVRLRKGLGQLIVQLHKRATGEEKQELVTPTGMYELDELLNGGFRKGTLTYVAGRPGNGKSTMLLNMALNASLLYDIPTAVFTLEMPMEELLIVMLSMISEKLYPNEGVPSMRLERPELITNEEWVKLVRAFQTLKDIPLYLVDCDGANISQLSLLATEYRNLGVDSFYVDYWQLIRTPRGLMPEKEAEFAETSEGLRRLAKSLDAKFIVGAQVNRNNDNRDNKIPTMRDIRNSGKAEQDAHRIITLHFPENYAPSPQECERPNELDVAIVKNRRGRTGKIVLYFNKEYGLLENMNKKTYVEMAESEVA